MSNVDRTKLNALLPNLTIGQTALPQLRSDVFNEIYANLDIRPDNTEVLTKVNTTSYTPTTDFHPATKKYTQDSINAAISSVVGTPIVQTGTLFPSTPASGQTFFDTSKNEFNVFASSQWNASVTKNQFLNFRRARSMGGMV